MAKTKIRITNNNSGWVGDYFKMYLQKTLLLRYCEKVGDSETVNNYQLGLLNEAKRRGCIDFEKVKETSRDDLRKLYKDLEKFVAEYTPEEYKEKRDAFVIVFTEIHQRERKTK